MDNKMESDDIHSVGIDGKGRLWVKPATKAFPYIYREAMDVEWDPQHHCLVGKTEGTWTSAKWFQQIIEAAREQGCHLVLSENTHWVNVSIELKQDILSSSKFSAM
jgi:hypothetical protein